MGGPDPALTNVTVTAFEDETGFAGNWNATAWAICSHPLPE